MTAESKRRPVLQGQPGGVPGLGRGPSGWRAARRGLRGFDGALTGGGSVADRFPSTASSFSSNARGWTAVMLRRNTGQPREQRRAGDRLGRGCGCPASGAGDQRRVPGGVARLCRRHAAVPAALLPRAPGAGSVPWDGDAAAARGSVAAWSQSSVWCSSRSRARARSSPPRRRPASVHQARARGGALGPGFPA